MALPWGSILGGAGAATSLLGLGIGSSEANRVAKILRNLPEFQTLDLTGEQGKTVTGNLQTLADAKSLASQVNEFSNEQLIKAMRGAVPQFEQIRGGVSGNIASMLRGEIPQDVKDQVTRAAAERAVAGGVSGSPFAEGVRLRDLGLTSLQLTQQGINSAMNWLGTAKQTMVAPQMDVSAMFLTPAQRVQAEFQNRMAKYESDITKALGKTAPGVTGYWSQGLQRIGGQMMGAGASLLGGA